MKQVPRLLCFALVVLWAGRAAWSGPLSPVITSDEISFDNNLVYSTNGTAPDRLVTVTKPPDGQGGDATVFHPAWPAITPALPLFYIDTGLGGPIPLFGANVLLDVLFNGSDLPSGSFPFISLTGTGGRPGADLMITGAQSIFDISNSALWAIDLSNVSLYGNATAGGFVLEGVGNITGGTIAVADGLVGKSGVFRSHVDFNFLAGGNPFLTPGYNPADDVGSIATASLTGATGVGVAIPEPSGLVLGAAALACLVGVSRHRRSACN